MNEEIISRRSFLIRSASGVAALMASRHLVWADGSSSRPVSRPNIIFILADDLGYGDLGCYGQKLIRTPNLDNMAAGGMRFTQAYCGTSVCAPSRCSLMTGLHLGHAPIRANRMVPPEGQMPLPPGTFTVPRLLKDAGYDTACIGKWGLGFWGTGGDPNKVGFDHFFGYICQMKAHDYYPDYLWRNGVKVPLDGKTYSHDLLTREALAWIGRPRGNPFFLYLAYTLPHPAYTIPDLGEYSREDWNEQEKIYAAMVTKLDHDVGALLELLKSKGIHRDTIVFFASDNGPQSSKIFNSTAGLNGGKRGMGEGSLRTPMIVFWPGHVPAGKTSDEPWAFWDFLPTCAELAGTEIPENVPVDGLSVLQCLLGGNMPTRKYFYWELHEGPCKQAVRFGPWKAFRNKPGQPLCLFDLARDPFEKNNLAAKMPELVAKAEEYMKEARVETPEWPLNGNGREVSSED